MQEATIDENGVIECGKFMYVDGWLCSKYESGYNQIIPEYFLDDLYAVLHARHIAQHYNSELMARIEKAVEAVKDDGLYKGGD